MCSVCFICAYVGDSLNISLLICACILNVYKCVCLTVLI